MTAVPLNKIEKLLSLDLEQAGRVVEPNKVGRASALFAIMEICSRTFPNELYPLDLYDYFPCRSTVHFFLGYPPSLHATDTTDVPRRSIIDFPRSENP